jgi:hypothetical protein
MSLRGVFCRSNLPGCRPEAASFLAMTYTESLDLYSPATSYEPDYFQAVVLESLLYSHLKRTCLIGRNLMCSPASPPLEKAVKKSLYRRTITL